jgi:hypothetical protein
LLSRFTGAGVVGSPLLGVVAHLAVSAIYGMGFYLIWHLVGQRLPGPARGARLAGGLAYGLVLFAAAEWVILPGVGSSLLGIPAGAFGVAHGVYGVVLGMLMARR